MSVTRPSGWDFGHFEFLICPQIDAKEQQLDLIDVSWKRLKKPKGHLLLLGSTGTAAKLFTAW